MKVLYFHGFAISYAIIKENFPQFDEKETWKSTLLHSLVEYNFTFYNNINSLKIIKVYKHYFGTKTFSTFYS